MKFDLKQFKKVHEGKTHTIMAHPDGHELRINNQALDPKMRGEISSPKYMADGGDTAEPEETQPEPTPAVDLNQEDVNPNVAPQPTPWQGSYGVQPKSDGIAPTPTNIPPRKQDKSTIPEVGDIYSGESDIQKGLEAQQAAESDLGMAKVTALQKLMDPNDPDSMQSLNAKGVENLNKWNDESKKFMNEQMQGHIDPNHLWENKSLPGKISSAIGLILGGIGGGLTHQENPALKFLHSQIENDIYAQRLNMSNKYSLLNAMRAQYGNEKDALDATRLMKADQIQNEMNIAAAKSQDPMAKARLLQASGQLKLQYDPLKYQFAIRQGAMQGLQDGSVSPSTFIQYSDLIPDAQKTQAFKELGNYQENEKLRHDFQTSFDDLNKNALAGHLSPSDRASAINSFAGRIAKVGEGRFNLEEAKLQAQALLPGIESKETRQAKQQRLNQFFDSLATTPTLDSVPGLKQQLKRSMTPIRKSAPVIGKPHG